MDNTMAAFSNCDITTGSITEGQTYLLNSSIVNEEHYSGRIQPLEFMQANMTKEEFIGFLKGNIIKYVSRAGKKKSSDIKDDLAKAKRYLSWLEKAVNGDIIDPREK